MDIEATVFGGGTAVITGAGSGIGAGLVTRAAALGMRVVLADIRPEEIEQRAAELTRSGVEAIAVPTDVADPRQIETLASVAYDAWGEVTLLVNNAGIELHGDTWGISVDQWQRIVGVNLNGAFYGMRSFIPRMLKQPRAARIVNMCSVASLGINAGTSGYAATKHALLALSECAAAELKAITNHVVVSAAIPGPVRSHIFSRAMTAASDPRGAGARNRDHMSERLAQIGIEPAAAAAIILNGAARSERRIHTDPSLSREFIARRSADLSF